MRILALDLAEYKTGWAYGEAGTKPKVDVIRMRFKGERTEDAVERFAKWVNAQIKLNEVELLVVEKFLPSGAKLGETTDFVREGAIGLNYSARTVAALCNIEFRTIYPATIRKHFIKRASMGSRVETKRAVIKMAQLLGYIPRDCFEDNMADAAALFDFASSHFASKAAAFQLA